MAMSALRRQWPAKNFVSMAADHVNMAHPNFR